MNNTAAIHTRSREASGTVRQLVAERVAGLPAWVLLTQLFIGFGWLRAAAEKLIDPDWWTGGVIDAFVSTHYEGFLGWYQPFLDAVVTPAAPLIALVVVAAQLVAGMSLTTGRRLGLGLAVGMFLNLHFLAAGAVTPSAFYLLAQGALALWLAERSPTARSARALRVVSTVAMFLAGLSVPFISTVHPEHVIDDPAVMFAFGGVLATVACLLAHERATGSG
ncbi:MAG: hypothetical protein HKN24_12090 [Acidimicrobiales bacterium]|nr:hypothetical protein [Acidimicrobiales bacterium]